MLGLIYEGGHRADSGRTKDLELQPVESYVVDNEKMQQLKDKQEQVALGDALTTKGSKKGILTNGSSLPGATSTKDSQKRQISFKE